MAVDNRRGATRRHNIWAPFPIKALCIVIASWFDRRAMAVVARGNPVGVRDCPAAVNGNDRRHKHWIDIREATASRTTGLGRFARESEDLPSARTPARVRGGSVVSWEDPPGRTAYTV